MKNKIYYLGIICCLSIVTACMLKIYHWPGGGPIFVLGFFLYTLIFMPVALINSFRAEQDRKLKMLYIVAYICVLIDCTGVVFKVQHWPGAGMLMLTIPLPFVLFLPAYLLYIRKNKQLNYNNLLLVLFFFAYWAVISALLSLNVSKNIIDESIIASYNYEQKAKLAADQTTFIVKSLPNNNAKDSAKHAVISNIKAKTADLYKMIDNLKVELVKAADSDNQRFIGPDGNINLWNIDGKDNKDVGMQLLFDTDKLKELKNTLKDYYNYLLSNINHEESVVNFINQLLNIKDTKEKSWEEQKFLDQNMIAVIQTLSLLKNNVSLAELETVSAIEGNI